MCYDCVYQWDSISSLECESWHAEAGPSGTAEDPKAAYDARASGGFGRATLVVCPLVAVLQWRQEIERFTTPGTLKVRQNYEFCASR